MDHADLGLNKALASRRLLVALLNLPDDPEEVGATRQHQASAMYAVVWETLEDVATSVATFEAGKEPCKM